IDSVEDLTAALYSRFGLTKEEIHKVIEVTKIMVKRDTAGKWSHNYGFSIKEAFYLARLIKLEKDSYRTNSDENKYLHAWEPVYIALFRLFYNALKDTGVRGKESDRTYFVNTVMNYLFAKEFNQLGMDLRGEELDLFIDGLKESIRKRHLYDEERETITVQVDLPSIGNEVSLENGIMVARMSEDAIVIVTPRNMY
ncbi:MAG: hypothetical protein GY706_13690, partial [Bacteroides sp.]|nr:hypothetical protein [Bacteroides sp.]